MRKSVVFVGAMMLSVCGFAITSLEFSSDSGDRRVTGYRSETAENFADYYSAYFLTASEANQFVDGTASASAFSQKLESLFASSGYASGVVGSLASSASMVPAEVYDSLSADPVRVALAVSDIGSTVSYENGFAVLLYDNGTEQAYSIGVNPVGSVYQISSWLFDDVNKTAWKSFSSVPEPTSGLLLLIGMAGLALKRKRA